MIGALWILEAGRDIKARRDQPGEPTPEGKREKGKGKR
jgi:hypothetical protein